MIRNGWRDVVAVTKEIPAFVFRRRYCYHVTGAICATSWLIVLGWLPFHSIGVAVALCGVLSTANVDADLSSSRQIAAMETPMCVDPGVWTLFHWIGHSATVGLVPLVWLIGDRAIRTRAVGLITPSCCATRTTASSTVGGRSTASSTCATDLTSNGSRRHLDSNSTL